MKFTISFLAIAAMVFTTSLTTAQTTHQVDVSGLVFTPDNLTIDIGDTVEWTNTAGSHNVNGTTETNPDNPESFGNDVGAGWTFSHTFTIAGEYTYQCDPHAQLGMIGTITVVTAQNIDEEMASVVINIFPQPAAEVATFDIQMGSMSDLALEIYDLTGRMVHRVAVHTSGQVKVEVADWNTGNYVYQVKNADMIVSSGTMMVR